MGYKVAVVGATGNVGRAMLVFSSLHASDTCVSMAWDYAGLLFLDHGH